MTKNLEKAFTRVKKGLAISLVSLIGIFGGYFNNGLANDNVITKQEKKLENLINAPERLKEIKGVYTLERGRYKVDFDINVSEGSSLVVKAGTELYFTENRGITNKGNLEIKGEKGLEVILTAFDENKGWKNVCSEATLTVENTIFSYAKEGAIEIRGEDFILRRIAKDHVGKEDSIGKIVNSVFINNSATNGGGAIYNYGYLTIEDENRFEGNSTEDGRGGAIFNYGKLNIKGKNVFENNHSTTILNWGDLTIEGENVFKGNPSEVGSAIDNDENGNLIIRGNNVFEGNSAHLDGGAISNYGKLTIIEGENVFKKNYTRGRIGHVGWAYESFGGGAIFNHNFSNLIIRGNNVFEGNSAHLDGGAILNHGYLTIEGENVFDSNRADEHGGVLYNCGGKLSIDGKNTFRWNHAKYLGGAIYSSQELSVKGNNRFVRNGVGYLIAKYWGQDGWGGGAIYSIRNLTIEGENVFNNNSAINGGGAINSSGKLTIEGENRFEGNSTLYGGGGIEINSTTYFEKVSIDKRTIFKENKPYDVKDEREEEYKIQQRNKE